MNDYDEEIWRPVPGFEGLYDISSHGNVRSVRKGIIKTLRNSDGTFHVTLSKNGQLKHVAVHKLVALVYVPNPEGLPIVYHKDGNCLNNYYKNIAWGNRSDVLHGSGKLRAIAKISLDGKILSSYASAAEAARAEGVSSECIRRALKGQRNSAAGFQWVYVDRIVTDDGDSDPRVHKCKQCGAALPLDNFDIKLIKHNFIVGATCKECVATNQRFKHLFKLMLAGNVKATTKRQFYETIAKYNSQGFNGYRYWTIGGTNYAKYAKMQTVR